MLSDENARSLALFLILCVTTLFVFGLADVWLLWKGGVEATFSTALGIAGKHSPIFIAGSALSIGCVIGGLVVHWWGL